jgi:hypothetical protein
LELRALLSGAGLWAESLEPSGKIGAAPVAETTISTTTTSTAAATTPRINLAVTALVTVDAEKASEGALIESKVFMAKFCTTEKK